MSGTSKVAAIDATKVKAFGLTAAGHAGVLSDESGSLVIKPCTPAEVAFYETSVASHSSFAAHIPTFLGTLALSGSTAASTSTPPTNRTTNIVLSNIAYGFQHPCILDVKLGAQLWDESADLQKRTRLDEVAKNSTSLGLGFRVAGMKVYKGPTAIGTDPAINNEGYRVYDKLYGRVLKADNAVAAIKEYFASEIGPDQVKLVADRLWERVREIKKILEGQESRMYSASLLFSYEGDKKAMGEALKEESTRGGRQAKDEEDEEEEELKKVEDVKLIDFAHAAWTPGLGRDENVLHGVRNIEGILRELSGGPKWVPIAREPPYVPL